MTRCRASNGVKQVVNLSLCETGHLAAACDYMLSDHIRYTTRLRGQILWDE